MKRDGTPLWRISIWVLIPVLMATVTASSSGRTVSQDEGESEPVSRQAIDEEQTTGAMRVAEAAAAARERRHITPRQRSMRRSHRRLENPEQLVLGADVIREFAGAEHEYLQFDEIPDFARQRFLRTQGILLTGYAGNHTYFAAVTEQGREFLGSSSGIVEAGKIPIEDKVERDLLEGVIPDWAKDELGRAVVHVRFHETVGLDEARSVLATHGGVLLDEGGYRGFYVLDAAVDGGAIGDLARSDRVRSISAKAPEFVPFNASAAAVSGINLLWDPPYNLNGAGYTVGVWDGTANYSHAEFDTRLTLIDWNDPVDLASMGFPDQHAIMVVEGHTPTETQFITQNSDTTTIEPTVSQPCYAGSGPTTDHSWMRVFDLNIEHYIGDLYCVDSVRYAVEDASGNPDVTFEVFCAPQHTADDNPATIFLDQLSLQYAITIDHPDMQMAFRDQPIQGCCYAPPTAGVGGTDLVIQITSEDCAETGNCNRFLLGSNDGGQTKPTYFSALDCEIFPADPLAYSTHATHVAGTIGASGLGVGTSEARGMANQVTLSLYDFLGFNQDYLDAIAGGETVASNNGWGYDIGWYFFEGCDQADGCLPPVPAGWYYRGNTADFGKYTLESWWVDYTAFIAEDSGQPFPIVFAAGNERDDGPVGAYDGTYHYNPDETRTYYDTINPLAGSKNVITVGSIDGNTNMTPYSSWGPCNDGRIKPDLVAKGHGLNSPSGPGFNDYYVMLGTSMAAAVVSGSAVLVVEQYENTFGTVPTNGEIKALLINSTIDLGKPGPDYIYGYGLLDAHEAVETILAEGNTSSMYSGVVTHTQTDTYGLNVPEGTPTIKATLAWMDWPGNYTAPVPAIVNDLDLRLISPTGQSHYPFSLSVSDPVAAATATGLNLRDTVEQVVVENPETGMWTLEVKGRSVPQGPQPYGLVSRNGLVAPTIFDMLPPPVQYNFPYPYTTGIMSAKYADLSGSGIDLGTVKMRANWFDVTGDAVITTDGSFYIPWYSLAELDEHFFEVTVGSASGLQTSAISFFNFVQAEEVENLQVTPGIGARVDLAWGDPVYDASKLLLKEFRVYRSTDIQSEMEWIGTTSDHVFTDSSPPVADMVTYEVHALFEAGSLNEILSTRNTPHRTRQPFIAHPRDVSVEPLPAGDTTIRILGMAEPGSDMTIYVDGVDVGTTTTLEDGSFVYVHDFGGPGSHSVFVQSKATGKSISVPSAEVDVQLLP